MAKITRAEARELLFGLLFETEFKNGENPTEIYELACRDREIPADAYIKNTFFGVITRADIVDAVITKYSKGWKAERLSRVSRTVLRIAVYEMLFADDIHPNISISQAVALAVKFGEDKAKQFVNGVLAGLFKDIDGKDIKEYIAEITASVAVDDGEASEEVAESEENV